MRLRDVDVDGRVRVDCVQLDLLVGGRLGFLLLGELGAAGADAGVGGVDVVVEDFLGLVAGGGDSGFNIELKIVRRRRRRRRMGGGLE